MSKVKLTREQAEEIEIRNKGFTKEETIKKHIDGWSYIECLNELTLDEMIRALYIGYEIEETFEVGDWVFPNRVGYKGDYSPQKIVKIDECFGSVRHFLEDGLWSYASQLRHATPEEIAKEKQRRWWAKHGRKPWELKIGDIIKKLCSPYDFEALEISGMDDRYIYAKDNHMINPKTTQMDANYRVVCFAEDRKDVQA